MNKILVTGSAGFIGFHLVKRLLSEGYAVVGLDNINDYYDINLKYARLAEIGIYAPDETDHTGGKKRNYKEIPFNTFIFSVTDPNYKFIRLNLEDKKEISELFSTEHFDYVIHLAAQAGIRYSIENPDAYIQSNIIGHFNILEACRFHPVKHLVFASSSSVYGANTKIPFSEKDRTDEPISLYAATKKSNELMAYTYSHLYQIPITGLRFFTVYGPWGRPDMSPMLFADAIINGKPISVFNNGNLSRDFTYVDDIINGILKVIDKAPNREINNTFKLYNIGCSKPVKLMDFISTLEKVIGKKGNLLMKPMQKGDVYQTFADTSSLENDFTYKPNTTLNLGIESFVSWFCNYNI